MINMYVVWKVLCEYKDTEGKLLIVIVIVILCKMQHCTGGAIYAHLTSTGC